MGPFNENNENMEKVCELLDKMNFYFVEWEDPQVCMPSDIGGVLLTTQYIGTKGLLLYDYFSEVD